MTKKKLMNKSLPFFTTESGEIIPASVNKPKILAKMLVERYYKFPPSKSSKLSSITASRTGSST